MKLLKNPKALVLKAPGTNCDLETVYALESVGFDVFLFHINKVIQEKVKLSEFSLIVIPGGFSFGDYISAGKIFAVEIIHQLQGEVRNFILKNDRFVIGICNGFQVLVKLGLLPEPDFKQRVTLTNNDSGKFECRWVCLRTNKNNPSVLRELPSVIQLPVAHAEGKFFAPEEVLSDIVSSNQILFQYSDSDGNVVNNYPLNPNGSMKSIAGITDKTGNIIGLMPHPERFISIHQYPVFREYNDKIVPFGRLFFEKIRKVL